MLSACSDTSASTTPVNDESSTIQSSSAALAVLDQELLDAFELSLVQDLLDPYYPSSRDEPEYGGFVENRGGQWQLQPGSKWVVAQGRYTWTASKAAIRYAYDPTKAAVYLDAAATGFEFLETMWGYDYDGDTGMALVVDRNGSNGRVGNKGSYLTYGHGFAFVVPPPTTPPLATEPRSIWLLRCTTSSRLRCTMMSMADTTSTS